VESGRFAGGLGAGDYPPIPHPLAIYRVITDSREARTGDLFVARRGDHLDGNAFVADALARGAALAIAEKPAAALALPTDLHSRVVTVSDGDDALNQLAAYARQRSRATVIAITGSVGKTSSKTMIAEVLSHHGHTHASQGGFNNHVGVPLTLANLPIETDFAVVEIGMNHGGRLCP
jgi:UDP-N-acetylmuramoyl-tripeptide--D-alanyl-D-alanine ligase